MSPVWGQKPIVMPHQMRIAAKWIFTLLFTMMALRFLGSVELAARHISSPEIVKEYLVWYLVPAILALAALLVEPRSRRLCYTLGWIALVCPIMVALALEPLAPSSFPGLVYFLMLLVASVVCILVVLGVGPDWSSYWGVLVLSFLLGMALTVRGASRLCLSTRFPWTLLCLAYFITLLSGFLMSIALPLSLAYRSGSDLVLAAAATLAFTAFLLQCLHDLVTVEARYLFLGFYAEIIVLVFALGISARTLVSLLKAHLWPKPC